MITSRRQRATSLFRLCSEKSTSGQVLRQMLAVLSACLLSSAALAFQIAPMGSEFEARLTNESEASLARTADSLGIMIKGRVHEEITQIGMGCPVDPSSLASDKTCGLRDRPFASAYVIYGVRWNDLPPFRLSPDEGNCTYLGKSCNVAQTIRFSTQPLCWYCLFKDAEKKAQSRAIVGCSKEKGALQGNVMTRSHFGDLQFLHAMASQEGVHPGATRAKVLDWLEFAWKVSSREIKSDTFLRDVQIPTVQEHFGCTEWRVVDLYILGQQDKLGRYLHQVAFGSVLHTVQDSFARAHVSREALLPGGMCADTAYEAPRRIVEFHTYGAQDGGLHDEQDSREAMTKVSAADRWPDAIEATRNLVQFYEERAGWTDVQPYMQCLFELADDRRDSSPGAPYKRSP
ncbi:hypothetical protein AVMA1855_22890 [Acidovorax sp. SUPP1855]|uniref:hypothetical protein n=1 Tax=Acidovorax sp. SUPP1855 TaxID=431774 RepID=UPI0023DE5FFF|nr:hypothetical protein [Acidovorax sp. SUPP1855]GKS87052.1 hypothetical protein AVMA1855_22890 [Acidovorax sp. SUPP1855]